MEVKDIIDLETVKTNMNVNTKEEALKESMLERRKAKQASETI